MRKIILNVAISLDGYIEDANGAFDWCFMDQDYGMETFLANIDAIFFGRKSYELMLKMDQTAFADKKRYVFSHSLTSVADSWTLLPENAMVEAATLKKQEGKDIWLFGGTSLVTSFMQANLVDELILGVHPILLGSGKPLFQGISERKYWALKDCKGYSSGMVMLKYTTSSDYKYPTAAD